MHVVEVVVLETFEVDVVAAAAGSEIGIRKSWQRLQRRWLDKILLGHSHSLPLHSMIWLLAAMQSKSSSGNLDYSIASLENEIHA